MVSKPQHCGNTSNSNYTTAPEAPKDVLLKCGPPLLAGPQRSTLQQSSKNLHARPLLGARPLLRLRQKTASSHTHLVTEILEFWALQCFTKSLRLQAQNLMWSTVTYSKATQKVWGGGGKKMRCRQRATCSYLLWMIRSINSQNVFLKPSTSQKFL